MQNFAWILKPNFVRAMQSQMNKNKESASAENKHLLMDF